MRKEAAVPSLIGHLDAATRRQLLDDLNYLNISEFRGFCQRHSIPFTIWVETKDGRKRTRDTDRKAIVLDRIRHYLKTGRVPEATCFARDVVAPGDPPSRWTANTRLYYGWYHRGDEALLETLRRLTGGAYRDGAIARLLLRELWTAGEAPTLKEYASRWSEETERGLGPHPEAAWLTDRANQDTGPDWKAKRVRKARGVLRHLDKIPAP